MTAKDIAERLGGAEILGREVGSDLDLADLVAEGLPISVVDSVRDSGLIDAAELRRIGVVARRNRQGRLSPKESNRMERVVRAIGRAEESLGSREKASRWMRAGNGALGGRRPIDLLESESGARAVARVLGRVDHGVYS